MHAPALVALLLAQPAFLGLGWPSRSLVEPGGCAACVHGVCRDGECRCLVGFTGDACDATTCPHSCHARGTCTAGACVCDAGFSGAACEIGDRPQCPEHCSGHGWCVPRWQAQAVARNGTEAIETEGSGGGGAGGGGADVAMVDGGDTSGASPADDAARREERVCACVRGWRGAACDVDTCPEHCSGRGRCVGGACVCQSAWGGPACAEPIYSPPPSPPPPPPWVCPTAYDCSGRGECTVNGTCACRAGFGGERCEKVAAACPGDCSGHGRCDVEEGKCVCSLGYGGEDCGRSVCADASDSSPRGCHGRGHCTCDRASGRCGCECLLGFAPPFCANTTCPADCNSATGNGECVRGKCVCAAGWRGLSCGTSICPLKCSPPNGRCVDGECACEVGWTGRACAQSTCPGSPLTCSGHGGCSVSHLLEVRCVCDEGFKGLDCATPKNSTAGRRECAARLCGGEVKGRCAQDDGGPCVCNPGWAGRNCTLPLCPKSCSGNGFCTDKGCVCYEGFEGGACDATSCPKECSGHGTCERGVCRCSPGWANDDCALPLNPRRAAAAALELPFAPATVLPARSAQRGAPEAAPP